MRSATCPEPGSGQAFVAQLALCPVGFGETLEAHTAEDLRRFRELNVAVVDDLDVVSPGVDEVEAPSGLDLGAGLFERLASRLLVVDDEAEVAGAGRRGGCFFPARAAKGAAGGG